MIFGGICVEVSRKFSKNPHFWQKGIATEDENFESISTEVPSSPPPLKNIPDNLPYPSYQIHSMAAPLCCASPNEKSQCWGVEANLIGWFTTTFHRQHYKPSHLTQIAIVQSNPLRLKTWQVIYWFRGQKNYPAPSAPEKALHSHIFAFPCSFDYKIYPKNK